jgi:hypothetical protein
VNHGPGAFPLAKENMKDNQVAPTDKSMTSLVPGGGRIPTCRSKVAYEYANGLANRSQNVCFEAAPTFATGSLRTGKCV